MGPLALESVSWWLGWSGGAIGAAYSVDLVAHWLAVSGDKLITSWKLLLGEEIIVLSAVWSVGAIADWESLNKSLIFSAVWTVGSVADWEILSKTLVFSAVWTVSAVADWPIWV